MLSWLWLLLSKKCTKIKRTEIHVVAAPAAQAAAPVTAHLKRDKDCGLCPHLQAFLVRKFASQIRLRLPHLSLRFPKGLTKTFSKIPFKIFLNGIFWYLKNKDMNVLIIYIINLKIP